MQTFTYRQFPQALGFALTLLVAGQTNAAPLTLDLTGNITSTTPAITSFLNTSVDAHLVFDLDEGNALNKETVVTPGEPTFTRWTFSGHAPNSIAPYNQTSFSGAFGSFANPVFVDVETVDNLDADTLGNPFGVTGVVDVLSVFAITDTVDCSNGVIDPNTGACSDPDAPILSGQHHGVNFIADSNWFSGIDVLPTSMLSMADLLAVVGQGENYHNGTLSDRFEVTYLPFTAPSPSAVPAPPTSLLLITALGWMLRRLLSS